MHFYSFISIAQQKVQAFRYHLSRNVQAFNDFPDSPFSGKDEKMDEDKREKPRVEFQGQAELHHGGRQRFCDIADLSTKGVFLKTDEKLNEGERVELTINLSGSSTRLAIELLGVVERVDSDGVGIRFIEMELDSFIHLRNVVFYADQELHEYYEFM